MPRPPAFIREHPVQAVLATLVVVVGSVVVGVVDDAAAGIGVATLVVVTLTLLTYYSQLIAMLDAVTATTEQRKLQSMLAVTELLQAEQRRSRGLLLELTRPYRTDDGSPPDPQDLAYREHVDNIGHVMWTPGYYTRKGRFDRTGVSVHPPGWRPRNGRRLALD